MKVAASLCLLTVLSLSARAEQSGLCEDLAKFTCSPGRQEDGTGSAERPAADRNSAATAFDAKRAFVEKQMRALIDDPESVYINKLALGALGLTDAPQCVSKAPAEIKKCKDDLAEGMVLLAKKKLTGYEMQAPYAQQNKLEEKTLLMEDARFAKVLGEIEQEVSAAHDSRAQEKTVQDDIFPRVKKALEAKIASLPINEKQKQFMIEKIKGISFGGTNCEEMSAGLNKTFLANAFYNPAKQNFKVCKGILNKDASEFELIQTVAHELAHAIGPCAITLGPEGQAVRYSKSPDFAKLDDEYPIQGLLSCLRTPSSIGAKHNNVSNATYFTVPTQPGANAVEQQEPYEYCKGNDQADESLSDWFAAEVLVDLVDAKYPHLTKEQWQKGFSNIFRLACMDPIPAAAMGAYGAAYQDRHPDIPDRVNAILLVNPKIRAKMGCEKPNSKKLYCDASNPELLAQIKAKAAPAAAGNTYGGAVRTGPKMPSKKQGGTR